MSSLDETEKSLLGDMDEAAEDQFMLNMRKAQLYVEHHLQF